MPHPGSAIVLGMGIGNERIVNYTESTMMSDWLSSIAHFVNWFDKFLVM